jgi:hypothetical protein
LAGSIFFNQNNIVLVKEKTKNKTKVDGFAIGSCLVNWVAGSALRVTSDFFFLCFFFNPARFQSRVDRVLNQPAGLNRILKLWKPLSF